jgi:hypothetical protein
MKSIFSKGLFGFKPLQFFRVGETPLLFVYFEIFHCNSSSPWFSPFSTSSKRWAPVSDRICAHMFRMVPSPLADMWAPQFSFFLNLHLSRAVRGWGGARAATAPSSIGERLGKALRSMAAGLPPRRRSPPCLPHRLLVRGGPGGQHSGQDAVGTALHLLLRCTPRPLPEARGAGEGWGGGQPD